MSDKFTLSDKMTYHFLRYIITLSSSLSHFNIRNTLGLAKYKVSLASVTFFSCVAALLFYPMLSLVLVLGEIFCQVRSHFHGQFLAILNFNSIFPKQKYNIFLKRGLSDSVFYKVWENSFD